MNLILTMRNKGLVHLKNIEEDTKVKRNNVEIFLAVAVIAIIVFFTGKISILAERSIVSASCATILWNTIMINRKFELLNNSK